MSFFEVVRQQISEPLRRIRAVARKEFRQLQRDPLTAGFVLGVPVVQLLLFGYAINQDIRHIDTALVDQDGSHISRKLADQLEATQAFRFVEGATSEAEARRLLEAGDGLEPGGGGMDGHGFRPVGCSWYDHLLA